MTAFRGFPRELFTFFEELLTTLATGSLPVTYGAEPPLKTGPPGYPSTHPRSKFLRWRGAVVVQKYDKSDWMHTPEALDKIREIWHGAQPLREWLNANVGATEKPVRSRRGRQT